MLSWKGMPEGAAKKHKGARRRGDVCWCLQYVSRVLFVGLWPRGRTVQSPGGGNDSCPCLGITPGAWTMPLLYHTRAWCKRQSVIGRVFSSAGGNRVWY